MHSVIIEIEHIICDIFTTFMVFYPYYIIYYRSSFGHPWLMESFRTIIINVIEMAKLFLNHPKSIIILMHPRSYEESSIFVFFLFFLLFLSFFLSSVLSFSLIQISWIFFSLHLAPSKQLYLLFLYLFIIYCLLYDCNLSIY